MRFVRQRHESTCAPIAVVNAARFFNLDVTIKRDWKPLLELCQTDEDGTEVRHIDHALRTVLGQNDIRVLRKRKYRLSDLESHLDKGGILYACDTGHAYLIIGHTKNHFLAINNGKDNFPAKKGKDYIYLFLTDIWMLG